MVPTSQAELHRALDLIIAQMISVTRSVIFISSTLMGLNARLINMDILESSGQLMYDGATRILLVFNMGIILVNLCIFYFFLTDILILFIPVIELFSLFG
jgi:hypothetical protein